MRVPLQLFLVLPLSLAARPKASDWKAGQLWEKCQLRDNLMNDFPWELTEWAPPDWGKDGRRSAVHKKAK